MYVGSARMTLLFVGPQAVGAFFLDSGRFRSVLVCAPVRHVSLFFPRALSTVQIPPPPASLISLFGLFYKM